MLKILMMKLKLRSRQQKTRQLLKLVRLVILRKSQIRIAQHLEMVTDKQKKKLKQRTKTRKRENL